MSTPETTGAVASSGEGDNAAPVKTNVQLTAQQYVWRDAYLHAQAMEKEWAETKQRAREHLEAALGDAEEGRVGDDVIVRWTFVPATRLDQAKLKEQAPELAAACMVTSVTRRFTVPTGDER